MIYCGFLRFNLKNLLPIFPLWTLPVIKTLLQSQKKTEKFLDRENKFTIKPQEKKNTLVLACLMACSHAILDMMHFDFTSLVDEIMQIA